MLLLGATDLIPVILSVLSGGFVLYSDAVGVPADALTECFVFGFVA